MQDIRSSVHKKLVQHRRKTLSYCRGSPHRPLVWFLQRFSPTFMSADFWLEWVYLCILLKYHTSRGIHQFLHVVGRKVNRQRHLQLMRKTVSDLFIVHHHPTPSSYSTIMVTGDDWYRVEFSRLTRFPWFALSWVKQRSTFISIFTFLSFFTFLSNLTLLDSELCKMHCNNQLSDCGLAK